MEKIRSYYGYIRALPGKTLHGALLSTVSVRFEERRHAEAWVSAMKSGQQDCIDTAEVKESTRKSQVTVNELDGTLHVH